MVDPNTVFEWNPEKAKHNKIKHGVSFEEAETAFADPNARVFPDESHSEDEARQFLIGYSNRNRMLAIAFIERVINRIRIVSARLATGREKREIRKKILVQRKSSWCAKPPRTQFSEVFVARGLVENQTRILR